MIRILVSGSRAWPVSKADIVHEALDGAFLAALAERRITTWADVPVTLVSGGARGVDAIAEAYAASLGWTVERHVADWDRYQRAAGAIRNQVMADLGADVLCALPLGRSPGTRDMIRRAKAAGIPTIVHEGEADG